jgi:hypothetical protein
MIAKPLDRIAKSDIDSLIENEVNERRTIEYKQILPGNRDSDKKEFLADVSSFANTVGGELYFGIVDKRDGNGTQTGIPDSAPGLNGINPNAEVLRLENMIRDGIKPRIAGLQMRAIDGFGAGPVLILRIAKSFAAPHMVTFQDHSRFYARNNAGKYVLDVGEIRRAFAISESLPEKVRNIRLDRVARIMADETPLILPPAQENVRFVLHLIPVISLDSTFSIDLSALEYKTDKIKPMNSGGWNHRYNSDGFVTHSVNSTDQCWSYVQVLRNGILESVEGGCVQRVGFSQRPLVRLAAVEQFLIQNVEGLFRLYPMLGVEPPVVVLLTVLGGKGLGIATGGFSLRNGHPIDRDELLLPDVLVENFNGPVATEMRPVFDALWQAGGCAKSLSYDQSGVWDANRSAKYV